MLLFCEKLMAEPLWVTLTGTMETKRGRES